MLPINKQIRTETNVIGLSDFKAYIERWKSKGWSCYWVNKHIEPFGICSSIWYYRHLLFSTTSHKKVNKFYCILLVTIMYRKWQLFVCRLKRPLMFQGFTTNSTYWLPQYKPSIVYTSLLGHMGFFPLYIYNSCLNWCHKLERKYTSTVLISTTALAT